MPPYPDPAVVNFTTTIHHDTYPAISNSDLRGRTVLITGASKGIGRHAAIAMARNGASNIIIAARSNLDDVERDVLKAVPESSSDDNNVRVIQVQLDVTSAESVATAVTKVTASVSAVDVLINSAGSLEVWKPVLETDPAEWWNTYEVNLRGTYLVCRAFLPLLLASSLKTVVNVASIGAVMVSPGASAYQSSKFVVARFTEFLSAEYSEQGLLAFSIHPGAVKTELALNMPEHMHEVLIDEPQLPADTVCWLVQERRPWLGGRYISANWDMTELLSKKDEIVKKDTLKFRLGL
ncbi:hypothetical protein LLEC1_00870 [Akanthomyces lecanii]|uniref:Ketoreductase domain-containing protein n=1 Tax=Cordyceps confragosa TaxID=2714763 RepID=A0A179IIM3_CORDF|nr:hypothetical protein LLEC1_00870 [Akanthomyces lecanii]